MSEPTLGVLENQEPQDQEDLESELNELNASLGTVRLFLMGAHAEEKHLMARRGWVRAQLRLLQAPIEHFTVRAEATPETPAPDYPIFNGTTEPSCPDCVPDEL